MPGKIKRRDRGHHAERLADHHLVDAARDVFEVVALHHRGNSAGHFHIFDGPAQFRLALGKRFAVFLRDDAAQLVQMIFEQHFQLEERLDAVFRRRAPPLAISGGGRFDRGVDFRRGR